MFEVLDRSAGSVIGVRLSGDITEEDYERLLPELKRVIAEHGELNFLCRFDGVRGLEKEAFWKDLKFSARHLSDITNCAVIKDQDWQGALARFGGVFGVEIRVFEPAEEDAAWEWLFSAARSEGQSRRDARIERRGRAAHRRLDELARDLRAEAEELDDPPARALFETSADVLTGLRTAFQHFHDRSEPARRDPRQRPD